METGMIGDSGAENSSLYKLQPPAKDQTNIERDRK